MSLNQCRRDACRVIAFAGCGLALALGASGAPPSAAPPPPGRRNIHVHDPSTIVRCGSEYWVFATGRGIPSFHSRDLVTWESGPPVFPDAAPLPAWVAEAVPEHRDRGFWAPDVIHLGDRYLVYYAASTFGKNTSAIGLATNPTLDPTDPAYHWTDRGIVVRSGRGNDFNAIDPAITRDADGGLWLAFGSFWSGIKIARLDAATGLRPAVAPPLTALAWSETIEAPYIYRHGDYYYLFVNWGFCCRGAQSTYNIRMGRSKNIAGPYVDKSGRELSKGGGSLFLGSVGDFIGPGHAGIVEESGGKMWLSCHFYDGTARGAPTLALRPLTWQPDGWPKVDDE